MIHYLLCRCASILGELLAILLTRALPFLGVPVLPALPTGIRREHLRTPLKGDTVETVRSRLLIKAQSKVSLSDNSDL